jgi:hypothetical protein
LKPICLGLLAVLAIIPNASAGAPFKIGDGDRIVLLGNTLIEREQRYGYWETALTTRLAGKKLVVRNLGWSGDNVFGEARARFGPVAEGFDHLKKHVLDIQPTVIVIGYGSVESFDGPAGLPKFTKQLNVLLDVLAPTKARIILLSPLRQENLGDPLPDPAKQNKNLRLYADALRDTAKKRKLRFVDFFEILSEDGKARPTAPLTDNGVHLTPWGYWRSAAGFEKGLGFEKNPWNIEVDFKKREAKTTGVKANKINARSLSFQATDEALPPPPAPSNGKPRGFKTPGRTLKIAGLSDGTYALAIAGTTIHTATAADWAKGVELTKGPAFDRAGKLRKTIIAKNELYFHRWRPQNETYLFGFRKGEQGKNSIEIPKFDPLVAAKEKEIAELAKPMAEVYQLKRVKK